MTDIEVYKRLEHLRRQGFEAFMQVSPFLTQLGVMLGDLASCNHDVLAGLTEAETDAAAEAAKPRLYELRQKLAGWDAAKAAIDAVIAAAAAVPEGAAQSDLDAAIGDYTPPVPEEDPAP